MYDLAAAASNPLKKTAKKPGQIYFLMWLGEGLLGGQCFQKQVFRKAPGIGKINLSPFFLYKDGLRFF